MGHRLYKRGEIWWAQLAVPKALQRVVGKKNYQKTTGHKDRKLAAIEAQRLSLVWLQELEEAKANPDAVTAKILAYKAAHEEQEALGEYHQFETNPNDPSQRKGWTDAELILDDYLEDLRARLKPSEYRYYERIYAGVEGIPLGAFAENWIAAEYARTKDRTQYEARRCLHRMAAHFPTLQDITIAKRQAWLRTERRNVRTVQKDMCFLSSYYRFLKETYRLPQGANADNPFRDVKLPKSLKPLGETGRRPLELLEIKHLLASCDDPEVKRFIRTAAYTGLRIKEIGALTRKESVVHKDGYQCLRVTDDAKTRASSSRLIPLPFSVDMLELPDEPVYEVPVGKRFGRMKQRLGYGESTVFHSIRKTFATCCEQLGIPEGTAADILGHEKNTLSYGLYSGGTSLAQRFDAMTAIYNLLNQRLS